MTKAIASTKPTTIKQSDAEFATISAAAQREDRCLAPPPKLKPAVRQKVAEKLIEAGLVREVRAKPGMPVWRREEETGIEYSLKLTAAGARAGAIRQADDRDQESRAATGGWVGAAEASWEQLNRGTDKRMAV